jgi:sensor histidine kinase YesM
MKNKQIWTFIGIAVILSIMLGILIHFATIISSLGFTHENFQTGEPGSILNAFMEVLVSSLVAFCTFMINFYIIKPFNSSRQITSRLIILAILTTVITVTLLSDSFFALKHLVNGKPVIKNFNIVYTFHDLFTGIIVLCGIYFIKTVFDKQNVRIENEKLKNDILFGQYESLKNHISPHFLFNSLTALRELIDQNPKDAKLYISHLSLVLRYTLTSIESQTKNLYEELEVANSYYNLLKIRFGSNLKVETIVDEKFNDYRVPPLAIQTLLENAVKHNEISKGHPLMIRIESDNTRNLIVTNEIHERASKEISTGIGLVNISKQYRYLTGEDISISITNNVFRVCIPLLNPNQNESNYS